MERFACAVSTRTLSVKDPWLRAKKLLLLVRRLPLNAACQLLCRSPLAVAPVLRTFAALFCARFVELRRPRVEAGAWKRVLGGWD